MDETTCLKFKRAAVVGASGGIGRAFVDYLAERGCESVHAFSRSGVTCTSSRVQSFSMDIEDESSAVAALSEARQQMNDETSRVNSNLHNDAGYDLVLIATGILHAEGLTPEKTIRQASFDAMQKVFSVNAFAPIMLAKHFQPMLARNRPAVFAALSARVGSIEDNRLGGWYAYRASKSALNMLLKTLSIELARTHSEAVVLGLHPGTVNTGLSEPFSSRVKPEKLFSPEFAVGAMFDNVLNVVDSSASGKVYAWDGKIVPA